MPKVTIDKKEIEVEEGLTIIQACQKAGVEIPHFCYHEKLAIAGNCRMCLVEVEKSPKLVASCAMNITDGMVVNTTSAKVQKAREGVMEFLLINHPLDCPICDQGGECDLQDQAFKYGAGKSRFTHNKRSVPEKDLGPLVKTEMNRCIHCMRCVRFATDIAGIEEIGAKGRGEHAEIIPYVEGSLKSEMSGNIIDLCPVGALTAKPYAFKARSWELSEVQSIDVMDGLGANILIGTRSSEVIRILPLRNDAINEDWLSDRSRFAFDGLKNQRLDRPYIRKSGKLMPCSWDEAIEAISHAALEVPASEIAAAIGALADLESIYLLKKLMDNLGSNNMLSNQFGYKIDTTSRSNYLFNSTITGIEESDLCLIIGANMRHNATLLNSRFGRMVRDGKIEVARIGEGGDQTYPIEELGNSTDILQQIMEGKHAFAKKLKKAKNPIIIVGDAAYSRSDGLDITIFANDICKKYGATLNLLHNFASSVGALDVGFHNNNLTPAAFAKKKFLYLLGADEIGVKNTEDNFIIYQGHHGDRGAHEADVILPGAAYTEKDGIYINIEGRAQIARKAVCPPGSAKEDKEILASILSALGYITSFDPGLLREEMANNIKALSDIRNIVSNEPPQFNKSTISLRKSPIKNIQTNYYMVDSISRASVTMAKCLEARAQ
mgnify:CR=1 FL=1